MIFLAASSLHIKPFKPSAKKKRKTKLVTDIIDVNTQALTIQSIQPVICPGKIKPVRYDDKSAAAMIPKR